jgi:hypothetical protein
MLLESYCYILLHAAAFLYYCTPAAICTYMLVFLPSCCQSPTATFYYTLLHFYTVHLYLYYTLLMYLYIMFLLLHTAKHCSISTRMFLLLYSST